jgi:hypothetical protein
MPTEINTKLIERIRSRCVEDPLSGCWEYRLSVNSSKYANTIRWALEMGGTSELVQGSRLAYSALKGEIPEDYEVDHLCKNKRCLNPHHLEAVTAAINRGRNRIGEQHPLTSFWFPSPQIAVPTFSSTCFIFASTAAST